MQTRIGRVFGRLTIVDVAERSVSKNGNHKYRCSCSCGGETLVLWNNLRDGRTKSCGCLNREHKAQLVADKQARLAEAKQRRAKQRKERAGGKPQEACIREA